MRTTNRHISVLGILVAVVGLTACGRGGSNKVVAQIAGVDSITEARLNHWIPVEAAALSQTRPVPGVVPDPPNYTACIAHLRSTGQESVKGSPQPTSAQLKRKCEQQLQELTALTLNMLIRWDWTLGEGNALGMKVTEAEVKRRFKDVNSRLFPQRWEFTRYLENTGQTVTDMLFRAKVQLFEVKQSERLAALSKRLLTEPPAQQSALRELITRLMSAKQWIAKTRCRKGFVVSNCRQ